MTKLGTPIGAGPNWATVRPGVGVGGRAVRVAERGLLDLPLLALMDLLGALALLGLLAEEAGALGARSWCRPCGRLPALPSRRSWSAPPVASPPLLGGRRRAGGAGRAGARRSAAAVRAPGRGRGVVLGGVEGTAAAGVGEVDQAVAIVVGEVGALRDDVGARNVDLHVADADRPRDRGSRSDNRQGRTEGDG